MTARTWADGTTPALSAANLNGIEADLDRALGNKYTTVTANYTVTTSDKIVLVNGSAITVTLPDPTTVANNGIYLVKNITNNTNIALASAGTTPKIDGQNAYSGATVKLGQYASAMLVSDGTNWWSVGTGLQLSNLSIGIDSSGVLHYGVSGNGGAKSFAVGVVGSDAFAVGSSGDVLALSGNTAAFGTTSGTPNDNVNYGLRIGYAGSSPLGRLWHKAWGPSSTSGWAPVTASRTYSTKTANYTLTTTDEFVVFNGSSLTATLPDPTGTAMNGRVFSVKNINASALSVVSAGTSKTIDGASSVTVNQWGGLDLISDGTQWLIRSKI